MLYCLWSCECGSSSSAHPLMSRRPAVRPTSDATSLTSHSLPFLLHQSEAHSVSFQSLPHSFARTPGRHQVRFPNSVDSSQPSNLPTFNALSPLEATLTDDLRVLPEISRNRPPATPAKSTLTRNSRCNPFRRNTYKKPRGPGHLHPGVHAILRPFPALRYVIPPCLFASSFCTLDSCSMKKTFSAKPMPLSRSSRNACSLSAMPTVSTWKAKAASSKSSSRSLKK